MTDRPAPLTPADLDLRDFPSMLLDVVRIRDSDLIAHPDAEVVRHALLAWCVSWHQVPAASLPNDDVALARMLGYGRNVKAWTKARAAGMLDGWILCSDGRLYHPVVAEKANEARDAKEKQRSRTEAARQAKQQKQSQGGNAQTTESATNDATISVTENVASSKVREGKVREEKEERLSVDFDRFWKAYPSRQGHPNPRKPALQRFTAAVDHGVEPAAIVAGAERYRRHVEAEATDPKFIAQAVTWLNQERWSDAELALVTAAPEASADDWKDPERRRLKSQILDFREGKWRDFNGPKPGELGCMWPDWLQREELDRVKAAAA